MEKSKTDLALIEEASRYGNVLNFKGTLVSGLSPPLCFFHGRTPEREYYDYSGAVCEAGQGETPLCMLNASGFTEGKTVSRWELVEANYGCSIVSGEELRPVQPKPHEGSDWEEASWEESDLARFSNFLGFSTEGLEKEIMDFLEGAKKIRVFYQLRRREKTGWWQARKRVSNIRSPMKLRLLSWNVRGANDSSKRKVPRVGALEASGSAGGIFGAIRGLWDVPWCLGGDVNITLFQGERSRQGRTTGAMRRFAQMVDEFELTDLPLQGGRCTWNGGRGSQSWARLDRFLVTQNWLDHFSGVVQSRLPRPTSDHFPILLECGGLRRGPSPFRFENMWLKVVGFKNLLRGWWQETVVRGTASFRLASKLKELKKIKVWNREVFGRLEVNKNLALHQVEHWDGVESERILSVRETELKKEAKENYQKIKINGVWLSEEQEVKEGIVNVFQQLLSEESGWKADIEGLHLNGWDKAPGPDGFTVAFWQECWDFVKEEILELFKEFYEQRSFVKSLNTTFLVLIPKKGGAEDLGDFRPISLLGGLYKLLAKVLANRLKKVLGRVVSLDQNAFVKGRQILDASLIANEVIDAWQKRKEKGLICKLDIEKAYDSISWDFLMKILRKLGFGSRFLFKHQGVASGRPPLSLSLVLGMEVLSALLRRVAVGGFVSGCRFWGRGRMELNISHLLFADDTIIFCEARKENMTFLSWILAWFEAASGLRINLAKRVPHKASSMWDGVEEKMRRRLALWKRQYISKGGRVTLIKSTLASMPIYQLSLFECPRWWQEDLKSSKETFFGEGEAWKGKFAFEEDKLWKKVIMEKFGQEGLGWRTNEARGMFGVGVWKEILKEADWCWDNIEFKVGKGTKVRFWIDHWCGSAALSQTFPLLFELAAHRNATVNEVWDPSFGQGSWNISFSRDFNDWEVDLVGNLLYMLRDYKISSEEDSVLWKGGVSGIFRVKEVTISLLLRMILYSRIRAFGWTRGDCKSHSSTLYSGPGPLGDCLSLVWHSVGVP
ncbi:LINE-1 retrotransposable element ORF2 protein [Vitis vinifera]|uniref:LINE-1 retrotransposable element ORF2 protein n=1 Tax=Vitis vinifera TaxID=29760 RepID=A0A438EQD0_VITVI|nr:LINE-1 retrotransposable element ORF2 protein [Vitis vinifera]